MENEDGYMALDLTRRGYADAYTPHMERKDSSSTLHWWKIGLGASLAGVVALTVVLILFSLEVLQSPRQMTEDSHQMARIAPHPVLLPADLCTSENHSVLESLHALPKYNSCLSAGASCASVPSEICIDIPKGPLNAMVNQTAIIPVTFQVPKTDWDFIEVLWHHTQGTPDDFILKYDWRSCKPSSKPQLWWKRECHLFLEVMPTHQWKSAMMNAWLIIWNVEAKDAGRYQVTVRSNNMKEACSFVELRVTEELAACANCTSVYSTTTKATLLAAFSSFVNRKTTIVLRAGGMTFSCVHEAEVINYQYAVINNVFCELSVRAQRESHLHRVPLPGVAAVMGEAIVYADIILPAEASSPRNLPSVQRSDHRPCPRWHWIMLWAGLAGNIILVAAVIAMGVWGRNKNKELVGVSDHIKGHQYDQTGGEGSRILEDFKSRLKESLCANSTASAESGNCRLCPLMWKQNKDKCYWFSTSSQSWKKSNMDCIAKRSQLPVGSDQEFIQKEIPAPVWTGLYLVPTENKWVWVDGSPLNQTQYPAFPLEENSCGSLTKNKMVHEQCSLDLHWICQKNAVLV